MTSRFFTFVAAVLLVLAACGGGGDENEPGAAVEESLTLEAFDFYFEPTSLTVGVGSEVTIDFTNSGEVAHSFTSTDLDVEVEANGAESASVTFTAPDEPGSFDFFCKFHPDDMQGTISVGGSDEPAEEEPEDPVEEDTEEEEDSSDVGRDDY